MENRKGDEHAILVWISRVSRWFAWAGGALVLFSALPITFDVFARKVFNTTVFESYEVTTYLFAVAVSFGYGYALLVGAHIRVDVIYGRLPRSGQLILNVFAYAAMAAMALFLAWYGADTAFESLAMGAVANTTLGTPLALPQLLWAAGLTWFALVAAIALLRLIWLVASGQADLAEQFVAGSEVPVPDTQEDATKQ